jgi:hypothetical protein
MIVSKIGKTRMRYVVESAVLRISFLAERVILLYSIDSLLLCPAFILILHLIVASFLKQSSSAASLVGRGSFTLISRLLSTRPRPFFPESSVYLTLAVLANLCPLHFIPFVCTAQAASTPITRLTTLRRVKYHLLPIISTRGCRIATAEADRA